ncbi:hypothetical protein Syn7502_01654 [Synechococcus sp. PCC 7502]|uniref:hypothetical protein n=1 Tax=Synechococcus sp. PCC 7502 TaxID=1173263 RepID=UPI00029FC8F1|nr:hypothetical protein [Synechococcus sp. PCC 7502]AFY73710.1 hypothetical protein Syn7502_01654 [Synechococcus sp. PCC 7502]
MSNNENNESVTSLAQVWAKKYIQSLAVESGQTDPTDLKTVLSQPGRQITVTKLQEALRYTSAQAWAKTETLLAPEVQKHNINTNLIDPWQISVDSHALFDKTLDFYTQKSALRPIAIASLETETTSDFPSSTKLATEIAKDVGRVRHKYTSKDPRVIGFVSMQFHYTGQMLLELLNPIEKATIGSYFKVIDDHLYMPLQRAYEAAADHTYNSPELIAVRDLMPMTSEIAQAICDNVIEMYPTYNCYNGKLPDPAIRASSIRDVEMFQIYLCLSVLEGNLAAIQEELFPLCVMLYPPLKVSWGLIRNMLRLLGQELAIRLNPTDMDQFRPYVKALWGMFSEEVLIDREAVAA